MATSIIRMHRVWYLSALYAKGLVPRTLTAFFNDTFNQFAVFAWFLQMDTMSCMLEHNILGFWHILFQINAISRIDKVFFIANNNNRLGPLFSSTQSTGTNADHDSF